MPSLAWPRIFAPGRDVAGERDHAHPGVLRERCSDRWTAPAHDVHDAGREDLREQLTQFQGRKRRLFGGLEHAGVAGGERRAELPCGHHQRVVPRRDRRHDADRVTADHAGEARQVFAGDGARHRAAGAREEPEHVRDGRDLVVQRRGQRLPAVQRLDFRERRAVRLDAIRKLQQQRRAVLWSGARPALERRVRRFHCRVDLPARGLRHLRQHLARRRVQDLLDLALARDELAVDEQSGLHVSHLLDKGSRTRTAAQVPPCSSVRVR